MQVHMYIYIYIYMLPRQLVVYLVVLADYARVDMLGV